MKNLRDIRPPSSNSPVMQDSTRTGKLVSSSKIPESMKIQDVLNLDGRSSAVTSSSASASISASVGFGHKAFVSKDDARNLAKPVHHNTALLKYESRTKRDGSGFGSHSGSGSGSGLGFGFGSGSGSGSGLRASPDGFGSNTFTKSDARNLAKPYCAANLIGMTVIDDANTARAHEGKIKKQGEGPSISTSSALSNSLTLQSSRTLGSFGGISGLGMKAPSPWAASNSLSTGSYASVTPGLMPSIPRPVNHRPSPVSFNRFRSGLVSAFPKFELAPNVQKFPLEEFSVFGSLPPELRHMIWQAVLDNLPARTVDLDPTYADTPALLHTSRESRTIARRRYTALESTGVASMRAFCHYINYDSDILVRNVAIPTDLSDTENPLYPVAVMYRQWLLPARRIAEVLTYPEPPTGAVGQVLAPAPQGIDDVVYSDIQTCSPRMVQLVWILNDMTPHVTDMVLQYYELPLSPSPSGGRVHNLQYDHICYEKMRDAKDAYKAALTRDPEHYVVPKIRNPLTVAKIVKAVRAEKEIESAARKRAEDADKQAEEDAAEAELAAFLADHDDFVMMSDGDLSDTDDGKDKDEQSVDAGGRDEGGNGDEAGETAEAATEPDVGERTIIDLTGDEDANSRPEPEGDIIEADRRANIEEGNIWKMSDDDEGADSGSEYEDVSDDNHVD